MGASCRGKGDVRLHTPRNAHHRTAVTEMAADLPLNANGDVGRERGGSLRVTAIDCVDQADYPHLDEIFEMLPSAPEAPSDPPHQWEVRLDQAAPRR